MSGLIRNCITYVTRTGKALLNEPTSHGRNIRHIFFESNVLCSCRRRSIMQCSMCNQCSDLFTCIMNFLRVLCMILMVLSCVLCITLMVFIYVYYELFACTNLVYVISLFFTVFLFHLSISVKIARKSPRRFFGKNRPHFSLPGFYCSSVVAGTFRPIFSEFCRFFFNFPKTNGIDELWFASFRRIFEHCLELCTGVPND
jgi:hypothetical protein